MVPEGKYGDDNIQDMFTVTFDDNTKETCTTETTKSYSFDEKTKNLSAPF